MTREELKSLISEAVAEQMYSGACILDEDAILEAELKNALMTESAVFSVVEAQMNFNEATVLYETENPLPEGWVKLKENLDKEGIANNIARTLNTSEPEAEIKEKAKRKALKTICDRLGSGFKVAGDTITSVYSGEKGKLAKIAAIGVPATALATSIGLLAVKIAKSKKKAKENNENSEEEKKED